MSLEGCRLFHSSKDGNTYLLTKGKDADTTRLFLHKLGGDGSTEVVAKKNYIDHSNGHYTIRKHNKSGVINTDIYSCKKSISLQNLNDDVLTFSNDFGRKVTYGNVFEKSLPEVKEFCESFGAIGKRVFGKILKAMM